jgi:hypothetical protein
MRSQTPPRGWIGAGALILTGTMFVITALGGVASTSSSLPDGTSGADRSFANGDQWLGGSAPITDRPLLIAQTRQEPLALLSEDGTPLAPEGTARASEILVGEKPSASEFILLYGGQNTFGGGNRVYPNTKKAIDRAMLFIGRADLVCDDGECYNLCDHVAGDIWGYTEFSGYQSAATHWEIAVATGVAHPGDRNPPLGALLFWETGYPSGHVATYVGDGKVVSNATAAAGRNIYLVDADLYEGTTSRYKYLGWADPVFHGEKPGSRL